MTETFLSEFKRGFDLYRAGEWGDAAAVLRETARGFGGGERGDDREDGPSLSLLRVMEAHGCEAPRDWKGYRELTEK